MNENNQNNNEHLNDGRADLIFHPVRIRLVQALFGGQRLTPHQLLAASGGTSIATLYRHLNRLVEAGIVAVVEERPIRGAVEKVYALAHDRAATFTAEDAHAMPAEDQMRHFSTIMATLLGDFGRYLDQRQQKPAPARDGVIVRQEAFYLTDEEACELGMALKEALAPFKRLPAGASRRRHLLSTILLPVVEATVPEPETE